MTRLPLLLVVARRCAYAQLLVSVLVALGAFMIAIGTAQDINEDGTPLLEGATVRGSVEVAICALIVGVLLGVSAHRLRSNGGAAWWTLLGTELATVPVLATVSDLRLDSGLVLWIGYATLTLVVVAGLVLSALSRSDVVLAR